jgi:hypothetical protein
MSPVVKCGLTRLDQNPIPQADEIRLFVKVRNEAARMPYFLTYYRRLGVDRFFVVDNGSSDATLEHCQGPDCHTFFASGRMSDARGGIDWLQPLLEQYGQDRWCLVADADELLVYPRCEQISLPEYCRALEDSGATALSCLMVDMYPAANIEDVSYSAGQSFLDVSPFFDRDGYRVRSFCNEGLDIVGGPRLRVFYPEFLDRRIHKRILRRLRHYCATALPRLAPTSPPLLGKVPLVKWNRGMSFDVAAHRLSGARMARTVGALMHFKFAGHFHARVREELTRRAYFDQGREYQRYAQRMREFTGVNFMCDLSVRYTGSQQLLELGLIGDNTRFQAGNRS